MTDKSTMKAPFSSAEISAMAREAGLTDPSLGEWMIDYGNAKEEIEKFVALVADKAMAKELASLVDGQQAIDPEGLYWRLHSMSKSFESCDRCYEEDVEGGAYVTVLDAMRFVRDRYPFDA